MKRISLLLLSLLFVSFSFAADPDFPGVPYGPESRQFVDIYVAPSSTPTPVYFDAHGNGGTTNMPDEIIDDLKAEGISIVAWESLTSVNTAEEVQTGWNDCDLMIAWVKANAATYNFDTTRFIIGGSSRGSVISWKYAHSLDPAILGLYMYNALPDRVWTSATQGWYPPDDVKPNSPPVFFVYKFEPGTSDGHDPENGLVIMNRYDSLGIGDRDTMVHSIFYTANSDKYQFLVEFSRTLLSQTPTNINIDSSPLPQIRAYPNPFQDHLEFSGLKGNETFVLRTINGQLIRQGNALDAPTLTALKPGIYFVTIQSREGQRLLKLVKN